MVPVVYIFCLHMSYLKEWAEEQECVLRGGMFDHEKDLLGRITKDVQEYIKQQPRVPNKVADTALVESFSKQFEQFLQDLLQARKHIKVSHPTSVTVQ